jgi:hypothetical protein
MLLRKKNASLLLPVTTSNFHVCDYVQCFIMYNDTVQLSKPCFVIYICFVAYVFFIAIKVFNLLLYLQDPAIQEITT